MVMRIEQPGRNLEEDVDLDALYLKANLNPQQRDYLQVLKAKMKNILGGKTKQELADEGNLKKLNEYKSILKEILDFLNSKKIKLWELSFISPKGGEAKIELKKEIEYWREFYQNLGVDWINLPDKINLTEEDREEFGRGAQSLCPTGDYKRLKMLIIPAGLADTGKKYYDLHEKMTGGYKKTKQNNFFIKFGGFNALTNKSDKLKIILVRDIQNILGDIGYGKTLDKSKFELEKEGGIFKKKGLRGIDLAEYLVWQRDYFERTGKHLDEVCWTLLTENVSLPNDRQLSVFWDTIAGSLQLGILGSAVNANNLGCRLAISRDLTNDNL